MRLIHMLLIMVLVRMFISSEQINKQSDSSKDEYSDIMQSEGNQDNFQREIKEAFATYDIDQNGYVTKEELIELIKRDLSGTEDQKSIIQENMPMITDMMKTYDTDGNGLDIEEFTFMSTSGPQEMDEADRPQENL